MKLILLIIGLMLLITPASAWVSGYDYRMPVEINNTDITLTGYQYNFTGNTSALVAAGKMQPNGGACCVADSSDNILSAWNETAFNTVDTLFWVNGTTLGNITNTTHYFYYDNDVGSTLMNISQMAHKLGDDFDGIADNELQVDSSLDIGGFSCWANGRIFSINNTSVYIYNTQYESSTESHMVRHEYNITTNTEISEISLWNDSGVISSTRGIEKIGSTYHILFFYQTAAGANESLRKRESSDGYNFNVSTQTILENSTGEIWADTIKISNTEFWIYYTNRVNASYHEMKRIVVNESGYSSPAVLFTSSSKRTWQKPKKYGDYYYLYYDDHGTAIYSRSSSDGLNFGSETTLISGDLHAAQIELINEMYYLIYDQSFTSLRVANCSTPNGTFSYLQQLYGDYRIASDTMIFDIDKILMVDALMPENNDTRLYVKQLSVGKTIDTSKWDGKTSNAAILNSVMSYGGDFTGDKMYSISQFGPDIAIRSKMKILTPASYIAQFGFINLASSHFALLSADYTPTNEFGSKDGTTSSYIATNTPLTSWFTIDIEVDGGLRSSWYYDNVAGTNSPKSSNPSDASDMEIFYNGRANSAVIQADWVFARKNAEIEPTASLGAEESAPSTSNIIIPANSLGMFNNWTSSTTFSAIAVNESNDVAYSYYNVTTGEWESYYVGYSWNANNVVGADNSIMVFVDADTTITITVVTPSSTALSVGWNMLFVEGTDNETIADIKSDIGVNCTDVWWFNSTSGAYSNTATDTVQPCQGFLAYINTPFTWTRSDL